MEKTFKKVTIFDLKVENFKCHKQLKFSFSGQNAAIYGDNAAGKTSVYDALTWLLFGKSSTGDGGKEFEVKPLSSAGAVADHNAITAVEAVLQVSGEKLTLRRTLREVWPTKRGGDTATFDGNVSEYFIDGVPCKKTAFDKRVNELVPEDIFRLLTSVSYFAQELHWQKRRAVLFDIAGTLTDREIMATDGRFSGLADALGNMSVDDYRRKLQAEKKNFTGIKTDTPARLSECQNVITELQAIDFAAVEAENTFLQSEADRLAAQIQAAGQDSSKQQRAELEQLEWEIGNKRQQIDLCSGAAAAQEREIEKSRQRWLSVNQETFTGGICPTCGQKLPEAQMQAATAKFEAGKQSRLHEIEKTAASQKESKNGALQRVEQLREEVQRMEARAAAIREALPVADAPRDNSQQERLAEVQRQISENLKILGKRSMLDTMRRRVEDLEQEARHAAEKLEAIEADLFLADEFTRYKTRFVEDSINRQFQSATFRLFRAQANGGIEERCDVVYNGIPWANLNSGAKINVGIDIISTLSRHYGVSVPLFVDNAESVTRLESAAAQMIRLVVSESDKELRIEYEN